MMSISTGKFLVLLNKLPGSSLYPFSARELAVKEN